MAFSFRVEWRSSIQNFGTASVAVALARCAACQISNAAAMLMTFSPAVGEQAHGKRTAWSNAFASELSRARTSRAAAPPLHSFAPRQRIPRGKTARFPSEKNDTSE
jgi:hypothetical protein